MILRYFEKKCSNKSLFNYCKHIQKKHHTFNNIKLYILLSLLFTRDTLHFRYIE